MQRKSFGPMLCPVARTLERVGEWWSILILRDAFYGLTRFEQFQTSLGIAPNMLTRRLNALVKAGFLKRQMYSRRPPRHEYVLTERGRDFWPVLVTLMDFGNRHFAREGVATMLADAKTGEAAAPALIDARSGVRIDDARFKLAAGPAANEALRARMRYSDRRRVKADAGAEWQAYEAARRKAKRTTRA